MSVHDHAIVEVEDFDILDSEFRAHFELWVAYEWNKGEKEDRTTPGTPAHPEVGEFTIKDMKIIVPEGDMVVDTERVPTNLEKILILDLYNRHFDGNSAERERVEQACFRDYGEE